MRLNEVEGLISLSCTFKGKKTLNLTILLNSFKFEHKSYSQHMCFYLLGNRILEAFTPFKIHKHTHTHTHTSIFTYKKCKEPRR